jgi:cytochrome c-type biogenesis protein CcmF
VSVSGPFYNKVVLPMAVLLAALMATGPLLGYGETIQQAGKRLLAMAGIGVAGALLIVALGYHTVWAIACAATVSAVVGGVVIDRVLAAVARVRAGRETPVLAALRGVLATPRLWGVRLSHLGLAAIVAGVAGSSLYNINQSVELKAGASGKVAGYTLTYHGLEQVRRANHTAMIAQVDVTDPAGHVEAVHPERRFYDRGTDPGQSASEVAINMGLLRDVYLNLAGWENDGNTATIQAIINPLVDWIWIGGMLLTVGGILCLVPAKKAAEAAAAPAAVAKNGRARNASALAGAAR